MHRIYNMVLVGVALVLGLFFSIVPDPMDVGSYAEITLRIGRFFSAVVPFLATVALIKYILKD